MKAIIIIFFTMKNILQDIQSKFLKVLNSTQILSSKYLDFPVFRKGVFTTCCQFSSKTEHNFQKKSTLIGTNINWFNKIDVLNKYLVL